MQTFRKLPVTRPMTPIIIYVKISTLKQPLFLALKYAKHHFRVKPEKFRIMLCSMVDPEACNKVLLQD